MVLLSWFALQDEERTGERGGTSGNEPALKGVAGQFSIILHVHFFENARPVRADGRDAEIHNAGDLRNGFP